MVTRLGIENARALKGILADIRALSKAFSLKSIHTVVLSPQGELSLSVANDVRIVAKANHLNNPTDANGAIDWSAVSRIKIEFVGGGK